MPINYADAPDFFADGLRYDTREPWRQELKNIFLFATGIIYEPFAILPESAIDLHEIFLKLHPPVYTLSRMLKDGLRQRIRVLSGAEEYLSLFDGWTSNHYHLHADLMPRLLYFGAAERARMTLILPDTPYIRGVILTVLRLFDLSFKDLLFVKSGEILFCKRCWFVSKPVVPGFSYPALVQALRSRLRVSQGLVGPKRIYVKRNNARFRAVLNSAEVEQVATEYGFDIIDFDRYPLEEQTQLVSQADVLMGMHGAGLTNLLYMPTGSTVIEFRYQGPHHNHCYWHLASAAGIGYTAVFGEPDDPEKILEGGEGCNLTISLSHLRAVLTLVC